MPAIGKPKLKAIAVPIFRVHYEDLERYIQEVFGFEYDFLFATGFTHGMCPEYRVARTIPAAMEKQAQALRASRRSKNVNLILNVLAVDGYIPTGTYIIDTHKRPEPINVYRALLLKTKDPMSPECLRFKEEYKNDAELMRRTGVLDQAALEQRERARRQI